MKFAFVISEAENYAVQLFSAILKQNHHEPYLIFDPRLFANDELNSSRLGRFFDIRKQNVQKIKTINPDIIGFSVYTQDYQWALSMARMIKQEMDTPIIFGGIHCTLCGDQVIKEDCVDYVCVGEGEMAIYDMVTKPLPPLKHTFGPYHLFEDLDMLPYIDRDIFYSQKPIFKKGYTISTGRGCPYCCTFCASDALGKFYRERHLGKYVRQRGVENVIIELLQAQVRYKPKTVYFTDDVFTMNVHWLREFAPRYKRLVGLPFYCTANPGTIKDEELYLLKEAGCQMIGFGMQSCNEEVRKTLLKRTGTNARIKEVAKICHKLKINFSFDHIFQLPCETEEHQKEAIEFYNETRPDVINTFTMTYLPKIALNSYLDDTTKQEVDNGKVRTGMFNLCNDSFVSMCALLPIVNRSWVNFISRHGSVEFPFWFRLLLKDIKRFFIGRYSDIFFPIQLLFINMIDNIRIKYGTKTVSHHNS